MKVKVEVVGDQATVTWRGKTRTFKYDGYGVIYRVFSGKFPSGSKLWPLNVNVDGSVCSGGFANKRGAVEVVGWYVEGSEHNSRHNSSQ